MCHTSLVSPSLPLKMISLRNEELCKGDYGQTYDRGKIPPYFMCPVWIFLLTGILVFITLHPTFKPSQVGKYAGWLPVWGGIVNLLLQSPACMVPFHPIQSYSQQKMGWAVVAGPFQRRRIKYPDADCRLTMKPVQMDIVSLEKTPQFHLQFLYLQVTMNSEVH